MIHPLERRMLLAVTATFNAGALTVHGTNAADDISVLIGPLGDVQVHSDGTLVFQSVFGEFVSSMTILAGNGNDTIDVSNNQRFVYGVVIHGGNGDDTIDTVAFRSPGAIITGGNGDDIIDAFDEGDGTGSRIDGGNGDDVIVSTILLGIRGSTIAGGNGDDNIAVIADIFSGGDNLVRGGNGSDTIEGSELADQLFGDNGKDVLRGNGGDDLLDGGNGADTVDGGGGNDTAVNDARDTFIDVEALI